ncbi:SAC3 domain-containing protein 1 [Petromyzon marinus]|uniref:SAC3 domain-containing protein 1 n=1 Tax=Petromyzon marinus TaxID=7757 RepID=UPI003F6E8DAE
MPGGFPNQLAPIHERDPRSPPVTRAPREPHTTLSSSSPLSVHALNREETATTEHRRGDRMAGERESHAKSSSRKSAAAEGPSTRVEFSAEEQLPASCVAMCPEGERAERERKRRLHRLELLPGSERERLPRADPARAVKEYSRPAAGKHRPRASELRPPAVLLRTVDYLIDGVLCPADEASARSTPFAEAYEFTFDRLRAVRQDAVVQRAGGPHIVLVLEKSVRVMVYATYRLCEETLARFEPTITDCHLQECFSWLLRNYSSERCHNEGDFQALHILYNMGSFKAMHYALQRPPEIRNSQVMRLALDINRCYLEGNFVRFFRLVRHLPFLHSCAAHRHFRFVRQQALRTYSHGHSVRNCRYPLARLSELLGLDSAGEARSLCQHCGILVGEDGCIAFQKTAMKAPVDLPKSARCVALVDSKREEWTLREILHGLQHQEEDAV